MKIKYKRKREGKLKTGSVITCARTERNTIFIEAKPAKRKHNQPKSGTLHLTEDAAYLLLAQLIMELDIKNDECLCEIEDRILSKIIIPTY
jgi:hypothetical protein